MINRRKAHTLQNPGDYTSLVLDSEPEDVLTSEKEIILQLAGHLLIKERDDERRRVEEELAGVPVSETEARYYQTFMQAVEAQKDVDLARVAAKRRSQELIRQVAIWVLIISMALGATAYAMWDQILRFFRIDHGDHSSYSLQTETIIEASWPLWLPEGMSVAEEEESEAYFYREYTGINGAWLIYLQRPLTLGTEVFEDSEKALIVAESVQGYDAELLMKDEESILLWSNGREIIVLSGNLDYDTLKRIAESCVLK